MFEKPISLYTPVEIPKGRLDEPANVRPYSIQKYRENPFQEAKTSVQSLTDQKKKIVHWLRAMSIPERKEKFAFQCPDFVALLRVMFERRRRLGDRSFRITEEPETRLLVVYGKENTYRIDSADVEEAEEELIRNVILLSYRAQFDTVSLSERILTSLEKLFEIFEVLEDGVSNELSVEQYRILEKEGSEAYFYRKDETDHYKKSLGKWLIEVLKKKLWCEYYRTMEEPTENRRTKEKKRFNKAWKEVGASQRRQYLKFCSYSSVCQFIQRDGKSERVRRDVLPKVSFPTEEELDKFIGEIVVQSELDIHEFLSQCTLEEACQPANLVKFPLLEHLKEYKRKSVPIPNQLKQTITKKEMAVQAQKKKKNKPKKKKIDRTKDASIELTTQQSINGAVESQCREEMTTPTKKEGKERKESMTEGKHPRNHESPPEQKFAKKPKDVKDKQEKIDTSHPTVEIDNNSNCNNASVLSTPPKGKKGGRRYVEVEQPPNVHLKFKGKAKSTASNETNQSINFREEEAEPLEEIPLNQQALMDQLCLEKQRNDLIEVADSISECANSYGPYRFVAFHRIQYLLSSWGVSIKIFGSCATGLALANSDIDLAVDPSILSYYYHNFAGPKEKVCMALNFINRLIETRSWISNIKLIATAAVPILKFEINPNIPFEEAPKDPYLNTKDKEKQRKVTIKVDLTIESFYANDDSSSINHLGIMATNNMKEWMSAYPSLHTVSIVLKDLLKRRDLNNIYKGGISSYALIIVVIAYMHAMQLTDEKNPSIVFYGFLEFLTKEFQHQKFGIDISLDNPTFPFFQVETPLPGKIQVKDPLNGKIVTCNSYQYEKILEEFRIVAGYRQRVREDLDLQAQHQKLSPQGKYFTRNYLQELFTE